MAERRPFEVFSVKIKAERGQQYFIDIATSKNGIPVFTVDSKALDSKIGYGLIAINNDLLVGETIDSINNDVITFTSALQYNHFGQDTANTYSTGVTLDKAAEITYHTRNIKILT